MDISGIHALESRRSCLVLSNTYTATHRYTTLFGHFITSWSLTNNTYLLCVQGVIYARIVPCEDIHIHAQRTYTDIVTLTVPVSPVMHVEPRNALFREVFSTHDAMSSRRYASVPLSKVFYSSLYYNVIRRMYTLPNVQWYYRCAHSREQRLVALVSTCYLPSKRMIVPCPP
jgi:hypothetical protein